MPLARLSKSFQSIPWLPTIELGPSGADSPGGWACVHSRTLWVSPTNSPVRLGVSPATVTLTGFSVRGLRLYFPPGTLGCGSVLLPSSSSRFIRMQMWDHLVSQPPPRHKSSPPSCPAPPLLSVWMNVSSVGLPHSSIFWKFWLLFVFKFVVVLLLVVRGGTVCLSHLHLGWKSMFQ